MPKQSTKQCHYKKCKANGTHKFMKFDYCLKHYRKKLKKTLNDLWPEIIKKQANGLCEICGMPGKDAHHIEGRGESVRWCLDSGIFLCVSHHTFGQIAAHSTSHSGQKEFHKLLKQVRSPNLLERIARLANQTTNFKDYDLQHMISNFQKKLKELDNY